MSKDIVIPEPKENESLEDYLIRLEKEDYNVPTSSIVPGMIFFKKTGDALYYEIQILLKTIRELEEEYSYAEKEKVVNTANQYGMIDERIFDVLDKLKRDGNIYEPKHGVYKIV